MQYYLLLNQHATLIEVFSRADSGWLYQAYERPDAVITLEKLGLRFSVGQVYEGVILIEQERRGDEGNLVE